MTRILITGANGFLGSNLVRILLSNNYKILAFSRSTNNISEYLHLIDFANISSKTYNDYKDKIIKFQPNIILHFAWDGGNNHSDINLLKQLQSNIPEGLSLLEIINCLRVKPVFFGVGSFSEYGIKNKKITEVDELSPVNFYGLSKKVFKEISEMFCLQNQISWRWIRPCFVYGPNDVKTRLIPSTVYKLRNNIDITLDSCNTLIDYIYIDDFCTAIIGLIETNSYGVFNICSGNEYILKDIVLFLQKNIKSTSKITFDRTLDSKISTRYICGSNEKIKNTINWSPKIKLEAGLLLVSQK